MKKKFLILVAIIGFGFSANSQDVILKQDGSEIKAKVLEITDQQIKYKDFDFQSGPIRNINISEIITITYENGQIEVFNEQTSTPFLQGSPYNALLGDLKRDFDQIGTNDSEMLNFFRKNNYQQYYNRFKSACRQGGVGKEFLNMGIAYTGLGVVLTIAGSIGFVIDRNNDYYDIKTIVCVYIGVSLICVGEVLTIVGIPITAIAGGKKRAIKNDFARQYFRINDYTYQPILNLGITQNGGIGLTLHF